MRALGIGIVATFILALLAGCGQKAASGTGAAERQAFAKAAPEVRQAWDLALEADRTNDYFAAQMLLERLSTQPLSSEQRTAVTNQINATSKRLWAAAEKGDAAAIKALSELRRNPSHRPP